MSFEQKIKDISKREPLGKERVPLPTGADELPFWSIPLEYLKLNYFNNRISTYIKSMKQKNGKTLSQIPFKKANEIVEKWIWNDRTPNNEKTLKNILEYGQMRPGIITADGTVVGGNRRLTILRKINREEGRSLEFKAVILENVTTDNVSYIRELESKLQHAEDAKLEYNPIQPYLGVLTYMREEVENVKKTKEWITNLLEPTFKGKSLDDMYSIGILMEEYLEYIQMPDLWSRITTAEDLFIRLNASLKKYKAKKGYIERDFDDDDVLDYKLRGFDLIRFNQNMNSNDKDKKELGTKNLRDLYFVDSRDKTVFSNEKIFNKFNETIIEALQETKTPTIEEVVKREGGLLDESEAAEKIDQLWAAQVKNKVKEAVGRASSSLDDGLNKTQPKKYLDYALQKLYNLANQDDLPDKNGKVVLIEETINHLKNEKELEDNIDKLHRIRKIVAEVIRQIG